ncbi:MAG: glutamate-5-semialdehyde dehydrogenase [Planctomycetes bacterium]|nr:glutamate-5-semialdehyde dehydrogenase [Planctomycetota bacterium]
MDFGKYVAEIATRSLKASRELAVAGGERRSQALLSAAKALREGKDAILRANAKDLDQARQMNLTSAMLDRLTLDGKRIAQMAAAIEQIAAQADPVGQTISASNRPNGLRIEKRRVPIGVIGIIFESRPNVTADAAALCIKSGNACILRGGKEAINSNLAIASAIRAGLRQADLPEDCVTAIDRTDHEIVTAMARAEGLIDLIIPRGGEKLIRAVTESATIPVIKHYTGNCHVYVHAAADLPMAERIAMNAKCQRPGVCNAMETLLVDKAVAGKFIPAIAAKLARAGVELRGCGESCRLEPQMKQAVEADWYAEYLDLILAVRVVDGIDQAIEHINTYGSKHTDAIVTGDPAAAQRFTDRVDSSSVMVNASTRFSDGGEYGLGAEVGISTDKLHARGPMGAEDLTIYKWIVTGDGQIRQ